MLSKLMSRYLLVAALTAGCGSALAFTTQLPIAGFTFINPLYIYDFEVGALDSIYTVPEREIAVITDVYITTTGDSDTSTHNVFLIRTPPGTEILGGPYRVNVNRPFSQSFTSGLVFIGGQQIVISSTGAPGDVTVNLGGYRVCADPC